MALLAAVLVLAVTLGGISRIEYGIFAVVLIATVIVVAAIRRYVDRDIANPS